MTPLERAHGSHLVRLSFARTARRVATIGLAFACLAGAAHADGVSRETALRGLLQKVDLPLARQVFARIMASIGDIAPSAFVAGYGRTEQLGDDWKPGNPQWDRAQALVAARLKREEANGGPVFAVTRLDVERVLDVPWTEDDIRFIDHSIPTPLGQALLRLLDAGITAGFVETIARDGGITDETRATFNESREKARAQYVEAMTDADRLSAEDPQRAERLRRLLASEDSQAMQEFGAALFRPSIRRFSSLMVDITPQLDALVAEFRARR